jgi:hypothetical protein
MIVQEAAAYLKREECWIRDTLRWEIPVVQNGFRAPLFFFKDDLDLWLSRHTHVPSRPGKEKAAR